MDAAAKKLLIIRADGGFQIGTGHLMRCLALAQAWRDAGGKALFVAAAAPPAIIERLTLSGFEVVAAHAAPGSRDDAADLVALARRTGAAWIVVDGYHFDAAYQREVRDAGLNLLFVDDYGHADWYSATLVLNQNGYASAGLYAQRNPETQLLLGLRYALLRREFRLARLRSVEPRSQTVGHRVLVMFGGIDQHNVTLKVLRALATLEGLQLTAVIGGGNPHRAELEALARTMPQVQLAWNVPDMPRLMRQADVAVSAAGSACWELACLGVPMVVVAVADNQRPVAAYLTEAGIGISLGWYADLTDSAIRETLATLLADRARMATMGQKGYDLVDGAGAVRVAAAIGAPAVVLRRATADDARLLWEWANEPVTRAMSFTTEPIPWGHHCAWLHDRLRRTDSLLLIATNSDGVAVGQVRFDISGDSAEISVSVAASLRGRGYGASIIRSGVAAVFALQPIMRVDAWVKPDNAASIQAFGAAGFRRAGEVSVGDRAAIRLELLRDEVQV